MKIALATIIIFTLLCSLVADLQAVDVAEAQPRTIVVPTDYPTIQGAIDNAIEGDTVFVKKGTYSNQFLIINKPISIVGEDVKTTILKGNNLIFPHMSITIQVKSNNVTISGFSLLDDEYAVNGQADYTNISSNIISGKVSLGGSSITIEGNNCSSISCFGENNNIFGNSLNYGGIKVDGSFNKVLNNSIISNPYAPYNCAIEIDGNSNIVANNKIVNGNLGIAINGDGIPNTLSSNNIISENIISGHTFEAIFVYKGDNNTIVRNYIANNGFGIIIGGHHFDAKDNIIYQNSFVNNSISAKVDNSSYVNFWDNGKVGNFWSDYRGIAADNNNIGDIAYIIDANNQDNYPLMAPANSTITLPSPSLSQSPSPPPTSAPTQTPTLEPSPSTSKASDYNNNSLPYLVGISLIAIGVVGLLSYFKKRRG